MFKQGYENAQGVASGNIVTCLFLFIMSDIFSFLFRKEGILIDLARDF